MAVHRLTDDSGKEFELHLDDSSRVADVVGEWPGAGEEFRLKGPLPDHVNAEGVPDHIQAHAEANGWDVCFYDGDHCRTCFCDDQGHMRCSGMC